jgi:hypothetical protein
MGKVIHALQDASFPGFLQKSLLTPAARPGNQLRVTLTLPSSKGRRLCYTGMDWNPSFEQIESLVALRPLAAAGGLDG